MKRTGSILGSAIFLVVAPGTIAGYLPWTICQWRFAPPVDEFCTRVPRWVPRLRPILTIDVQ